MKVLTVIAIAVIAVYVGLGVALNSAADVAMKLWGRPAQSQTITPAGDQTGIVYLNYQLQRAGNPQQPASVVFEATPSRALQP